MLPRHNGKIHYGVWILAICFFFHFFVVTLQFHVPGQFVAPMADDMGLSRSAIMSSLAISSVASMLTMLFAGSVLKRVNLKLMFCVCLALFSSLYIFQSYAVTLRQIYVIAVARGIISPFCSMYPLNIVLNNWYDKRQMGRVVTYAMIGNSLGTIAMSPLIGRLIKDYGWRVCYRVVAFSPLIILPLIAVFLVVAPEEKGCGRIGDIADEEPREEALREEGMTARQAVVSPIFWFSAVMCLLWSGSTQVWQLVGPSFLADTGRDPVGVAAVLSVAAFGNLLGKIVLGPLYGKSSRNGLALGFGIGLTAFLLAILSSWISVLAFAASFLFGFCIATVGVVPALMTAELFGRRDYGVISGYIQIGGSIGSSVLPLLMSFLYSVIGNYTAVWGIICVLVLCAALLLFAAFRIYAKNYKKIKGDAL
ncbi:MAG: MFS transporter [Oscillospiraceae bacterium]|nr:MFS transporter [Oscillospiraceae bacterium]